MYGGNHQQHFTHPPSNPTGMNVAGQNRQPAWIPATSVSAQWTTTPQQRQLQQQYLNQQQNVAPPPPHLPAGQSFPPYYRPPFPYSGYYIPQAPSFPHHAGHQQPFFPQRPFYAGMYPPPYYPPTNGNNSVRYSPLSSSGSHRPSGHGPAIESPSGSKPSVHQKSRRENPPQSKRPKVTQREPVDTVSASNYSKKMEKVEDDKHDLKFDLNTENEVVPPQPLEMDAETVRYIQERKRKYPGRSVPVEPETAPSIVFEKSQPREKVPDEAATVVQPAEPQPQHRPKQRPCKFFRQGKCKRGEECPFSHAATVHPLSNKAKHQSQSNPALHAKRGVFRKPLVESMLLVEVQKKQELIEECIAFILANEFFVDGKVLKPAESVLDTASVVLEPKDLLKLPMPLDEDEDEEEEDDEELKDAQVPEAVNSDAEEVSSASASDNDAEE